MWIFGILFALFVLVTSLIMPWINRTNINMMREKLNRLELEIIRLRQEKTKTSAAADPMVASIIPPVVNEYAPTPERKPEPAFTQPQPDRAASLVRETPPVLAREPVLELAHEDEPDQADRPYADQSRTDQPRTFEQQFGGQAFVWLGGIALALAGFFMVKYSIESGLLTERVRVMLGLVFGFTLLGGSHIVRQRPNIADGVRISQALAGAGIADLYGCLFAATTLYNLIPSWFGFGCMAAVTTMTLVMSLRYGAPIAALGLIGGFATPLLIHSSAPNAPLLFGYLYLVFGGLAVVARRQDWWWLSLPATFIAFAWVILWICNGFAAADGLWLALFLLGVSATVVAATHDKAEDDMPGASTWLRYIAVGGSLLLMGTITCRADFGAFEWRMFGLFSVSAITLAAFDGRTYGFAPWLSMAANAVMILMWGNVEPSMLAITIAKFGFLFTASGYVLSLRKDNTVSWAGLSAASALLYYLLAYHRLDGNLAPTLQSLQWLSVDGVWAAIAVFFTVFFTAATNQLFGKAVDAQTRHKLQAIFAVAASSFLATGFAILLHQEFLVFAIAAQILTISWVDTRVDVLALRSITKALTGVLAILLLPDLLRMLVSPFDDFSGYGVGGLAELRTTSSLLFRFGLPSAMLAASSGLLRKQKDDQFVGVLEFSAITLFTVMGYNFVGTVFTGTDLAFFARGVFTTILLLLSLATLRLGRQYKRSAVENAGLILGGLSVARIAGFDLLTCNPLWSHQMVGAWPVLNGLALTYALPTALFVLIKDELKASSHLDLARATKLAAYVLAVVFISFEVRQFYHGAYLDAGAVSNAEVYAYSVAWLALGAGLLLGGVMRQDSMMRMASLLIMLLTVGKVFLYDASELSGLWRVFSFLGLGLSLLGLSWFYSKFVFVKPKPAAK